MQPHRAIGAGSVDALAFGEAVLSNTGLPERRRRSSDLPSQSQPATGALARSMPATLSAGRCLSAANWVGAAQTWDGDGARTLRGRGAP